VFGASEKTAIKLHLSSIKDDFLRHFDYCRRYIKYANYLDAKLRKLSATLALNWCGAAENGWGKRYMK